MDCGHNDLVVGRPNHPEFGLSNHLSPLFEKAYTPRDVGFFCG